MKNQNELTKELIASLKEAEQLKQIITDGNDIGNEKRQLDDLETHIAVLQERIETKVTDKPTCPHCGYVHHDDWEGFEQESETTTCNGCGNYFEYSFYLTRTYTTSK